MDVFGANRAGGTLDEVVGCGGMVTLRTRLLFGFLLMAWGSGCAKETIAHSQDERDANRMLVLLKGEGIDAAKVKDEGSRDLKFNVLVGASDAPGALSVLESHNLPENRQADTQQMFQESGMIPTATQERAKQEVGKTGDIINQLRKVPGVIDVMAAVSLPEQDPLREITEERLKPKASVVILYRPNGTENPPISPDQVQKFVQARLPQIKPEEVNVLLLPSGEASQGGPSLASADGTGASAFAAMGTEGCLQKERVIGIEVCAGNKKRIVHLMVGAALIAGLLSTMVVIAVLRAMRYRKDLTRLTAQFERVPK